MRKKTKLGDTIEFQRGYDLTHSQMIEGEYPVIGSNGIIGTHNTFKTSDSIVLGRSGTIGNPQIIKGKFWPHNTTLYSTDLKGNNLEYMYYLLKTLHIENYKSGSTVPTLNRNDLSPLEITIEVDTNKQKRISEILSLLDETISTNNKIISELESMEKDIYDYWFVQFDFPDENGKPYKSSGGKMVWNEELKREIPEGWSNCTLEKLVNIVRGVTYEEGDTVDRPDKDHIMLLRANNIANEKINLDKVTFVSKDRVSAQQILIPGDILICMSSGSKEHVGKTAELPFDEKMTFGAFCSKIRCNDDIFRPFVNRTIKSNLFNAWVKQKALGTNINNLTNEIISSMPIVYPTKQIISRFHTLLCPIISKIYSVAKESRELTSLRDFLLPLLMNGQVKIGDVEP